MARPVEATKKEFIGYETVSIVVPQRMKDKLNKLPKGKMAEFIREAIDEKLKNTPL